MSTITPGPVTLVWLRRDLRLSDHSALHLARSFKEPIQCVFVFDQEILDKIPRLPGQALNQDRRLGFIHAAVAALDERIGQAGGHLITRYGLARQELPQIAQAIGAVRVLFAHDDEPAARARDQQVSEALQAAGIACHSVKDQCIFERHEVLTQAQKPFSVFTPYKNAWLRQLSPEATAPRSTGSDAAFGKRLLPQHQLPKALRTGLPSLESMGFGPGNLDALRIPLGASGAQRLFEDFKPRIGQYKVARDFPGAKGPSYLSVHLRFGTISIRELVRFALEAREDKKNSEGAETWLSELIWRDFYMQILYHHPHVVGRSFRPEYDAIAWETGPESDQLFEAWCQGQTGFPIVDASMRQLNATGYMHNRLRMVVASFLTKDLGIDWRRGEAYFAWKLNDFDLSANNGGWQWAASTGCDAQPYFRIFNPTSQSERFDAKGLFIRRYVPEIAALPDKYIHAPWTAPPLLLSEAGIDLGETYPAPVVDHDLARKKTLARFSVVKAGLGTS